MNTKTERMHIRLTKQEVRQLTLLARAKGVSKSSYIRAYIRRNARKAGLK